MLDDAGAHEGSIGLAGQDSVYGFVVGLAGGLVTYLVPGDVDLGQFHHLADIGPQVVGADGSYGLAAQVGQALQIGAVSPADDDAAEGGGGLAILAVDQGGQHSGEGVRVAQGDEMGRTGEHEIQFVAFDSLVEGLAVEDAQPEVVLRQCFGQVLGQRLPAVFDNGWRAVGEDANGYVAASPGGQRGEQEQQGGQEAFHAERGVRFR